jgi:hypothetical protein
MAKLNGNDIYLTINGTDVKAFWKKVSLNPSADTVDVTAGAGTDHKQYEPGLIETDMSISLAYETALLATYIQLLQVGEKVTVVYGPEGAVSGKPKHEQVFIVTTAPHEVSVTKDAVMFELELKGADAPTLNMFAGAVWS